MLTDGMLFSIHCLHTTRVCTVVGCPKWKLTSAYSKLSIIQSATAVIASSAASAAVLSCRPAHCH